LAMVLSLTACNKPGTVKSDTVPAPKSETSKMKCGEGK